MTREDKKKIERRAYWHDLLRQLRGTPDFPVKLFFLALFLVGAVYVATKQAILREQVKHIELISPILKAAMEHAVTAYLFVGGLALLTLLLYPFGRRAAKDQLQCIGLINHAGMPPDLLRKRRDKDNPRVTIWEFRNQSIPLQEWEKKCLAIETALGKLKEAHKNADVAAIDTALAELNAAWQAASQDIYAAQQQQGGAQQGAPHADAGAGTNGQQQGGSNQPEDVEFEEVK